MSLANPKKSAIAEALQSQAAKLSLIIFLVLSLILLVLGRLNIPAVEKIQASVVDIMSPALTALSQPAAAINDVVVWFDSWIGAREENEQLRAELGLLKAWQKKAQRLEIENQRLNDLLNVKNIYSEPVATARVVGDSGGSFVRSILINAGAKDGVRKDGAVMDGNGAIGRVITVGNTSARVLLMTDINSHVPVKVAGTGINAILTGDNEYKPLLTFLPIDDQVKVGDRILTSGHGQVFPPDLPVGTVSSIDETVVRVQLYARLDRLDFFNGRNIQSAEHQQDQGKHEKYDKRQLGRLRL